MMGHFNRRERLAAPNLHQKQRAVLSKDMGLVARVNRHCRDSGTAAREPPRVNRHCAREPPRVNRQCCRKI
eukprot:8112874-Pyramimonas_sp.AAC.1